MDAAPAAGGASARRVTFSVNIEVDHKALRKQVFNEGWRIMKNRFYDAKMHGADWNLARATYEPLLEYLVDEEELHAVMMMMIGELNASHTGVSGGPAGAQPDERTQGSSDTAFRGSGLAQCQSRRLASPRRHRWSIAGPRTRGRSCTLGISLPSRGGLPLTC
jgi:hypothetical protein